MFASNWISPPSQSGSLPASFAMIQSRATISRIRPSTYHFRMTLLSNLEALHRRQGRSPASQAGDGQAAQQEASPVAQATVSAHSTAGEGYSLSHSNSHLGHGPNSFDVRTLIPPHPVDWSAMHRIIAARAREASLTQRQASRLSVDWDLNGLERGTTRPTLPSSEQTSQEQVHPADLDETFQHHISSPVSLRRLYHISNSNCLTQSQRLYRFYSGYHYSSSFQHHISSPISPRRLHRIPSSNRLTQSPSGLPYCSSYFANSVHPPFDSLEAPVGR
jgi:hypothetical protein